MYLALRELRTARARFVTITAVVVLVAVLVTFISGLTAGLKYQNLSAIQAFPSGDLIFAATDGPASFDESALTPAQVGKALADDPTAVPIGIERAKLTYRGTPTSVAIIGMPVKAAPQAVSAPGTVRLSAAAQRESGVAPGDVVELGGIRFTVADSVGDLWYAHSPVAYVAADDWRAVSRSEGAATVVVSHVHAAPPGTTLVARADAPTAIASYTSENSSLTLITVMLFIVAALVVGSFFVVWTVQRVGDIATLKALGATTASLVRDSLGQAALVLVVGVGLGTSIAAGAGAVIGSAVPFVSSTSTTLLPATLLVGLGLVGSVVALRFLVTADPLSALGGQH